MQSLGSYAWKVPMTFFNFACDLLHCRSFALKMNTYARSPCMQSPPAFFEYACIASAPGHDHDDDDCLTCQHHGATIHLCAVDRSSFQTQWIYSNCALSATQPDPETAAVQISVASLMDVSCGTLVVQEVSRWGPTGPTWELASYT